MYSISRNLLLYRMDDRNIITLVIISLKSLLFDFMHLIVIVAI